MLMRSVLNHNLSTISFMLNNLALFEICIVVCCGLYKVIFSGFCFGIRYSAPLFPSNCILLFVFHLADCGFWLAFFFFSCFCTCQNYKLYLSDTRSLALGTHPFKPRSWGFGLFCIWWKLSFALGGEYTISVVLTHFFYLVNTHNTPIENRVNNKWQQQLGENYLEHVKIFQFKKRTSCRLFVCLTIKN